MKEMIIAKIVIPFIMSFISDLLTDNNKKIWLDKLFDWIEDAVMDSKSKYDDVVVLPMIAKIRDLMDVPDDD